MARVDYPNEYENKKFLDILKCIWQIMIFFLFAGSDLRDILISTRKVSFFEIFFSLAF